MKKYIPAIVFVCLTIWGGAKPDQIPLQQNKVCQIIFPDKIAKIRGGFNPNYFALDKYDNILYIQIPDRLPEHQPVTIQAATYSTCVIRKRARRMPTSSTLPTGSTSILQNHPKQGRSRLPYCGQSKCPGHGQGL